MKYQSGHRFLCFFFSFHSFIFAIDDIQIQQQYTEIYNKLNIIYTILTKLCTKIVSDKEAYIEAGGL